MTVFQLENKGCPPNTGLTAFPDHSSDQDLGLQKLATRRQPKSRTEGPVILSVVESCRRFGVPLKDYLLEVMPGFDGRKLSDIPGQPGTNRIEILDPAARSAARRHYRIATPQQP